MEHIAIDLGGRKSQVFDSFSSEAWPDAVVKPKTWLLNKAWNSG